MSDFDPYYIWLGIPETARPISKYRLLGIDDFEDNRGVISTAAERQTVFLRTLQAGEHEVLVAQLLNEISRARVTLLNADQKAAYDEELRKQQAPEPVSEPTPPIPVIQTPPPSPVVVRGTVTQDLPVSVVQTAKVPRRTRQQEIWKRPAVIGVSVVGVIGVFVLVTSLMSSGDADPVASNSPPLVTSPPEPEPAPEPQPETLPTLPPQPEAEPASEPKQKAQPVARTLNGHSAGVTSVSFSPDGKKIVSGSKDKSIKLWDRRGTHLNFANINGHLDEIISVGFSEGGYFLASGSNDGTIKLWDSKSGSVLKTIDADLHSIYSVAVSSDYDVIVSAGADHIIKVWDGRTGEKTRTLEGHTDYVHSVALSPDGEIIASGSADGIVNLWDRQTGLVIKTLTGHSSEVREVIFSPDGKTIASASEDKTIKLWDSQTGLVIKTLTGHRSYVRCVAFSPDGETIASGSGDGIVKLWDRQTGVELKMFAGHSDYVISVAFSPDAKTLASASEDKTIKLWDLESAPAQTTSNTLPPSLEQGLVAYYPFNGNAQDESGNGNHGFLRGTQADVDRHGNKRSCYQITGRDTWIELPAITSELSERTFALWLNVPTHNETYRPIISQHSVSGEDNLQVVFNLQIHNSNKLDYFMGDRTRLIVENWPRTALNTGMWVHLCFSYTATHTAFHINGQSQGKRKLDGVPLNSQQPIQLGKFSNNKAVPDQFLNGSIDDVRIYNRALSAVEVKALYEYESKPPTDSVPTDLPVINLPNITNTFGMTFNKIPAGTFMMGSPVTEKDRESNETRHEVTISKAFYMQTTEVTQSQWKALMGTEPWKGEEYVKEGPDYAATYVSWDDAVAYCKKLSEIADKTYRLPTEAEWEYACRAGTETRWNFGDDENKLGDYAWYRQTAWDIDEKYAHQVGLKKPNAFGLYDMHGNVYEWCSDYHGENFYQISPEKDPQGPASGSSRVLRGGSWNHGAGDARSAVRYRDVADGRYYDLGFRVVRELD